MRERNIMNRLLLCLKWYQYIVWPRTNVGHLRFYQQAMSKVISNPTTRSGIPVTPIVDTKVVSLLIFCRKIYQFIVWPWANDGHLGFSTHNAMSKIFSDNTTISGIPENPMIDTSNMNLPLLCRKWYRFTVWPWAKGGFFGFYPQCNVQSSFWPHY